MACAISPPTSKLQQLPVALVTEYARMDELYIFGRELSVTEVHSIYNLGE